MFTRGRQTLWKISFLSFVFINHLRCHFAWLLLLTEVTSYSDMCCSWAEETSDWTHSVFFNSMLCRGCATFFLGYSGISQTLSPTWERRLSTRDIWTFNVTADSNRQWSAISQRGYVNVSYFSNVTANYPILPSNWWIKRIAFFRDIELHPTAHRLHGRRVLTDRDYRVDEEKLQAFSRLYKGDNQGH